jgi:tetratricopeptide (TPR) repeat protein
MRKALVRLVLSAALVGVVACSSSTSPKPGVSPPLAAEPQGPLAATVLMQEGEALVRQGRVDEGVKKYEAALRLQPTNPTINNFLGRAELDRGNAAKALDYFNRALQLAPTYSDARANRGATYVALGQYSMAESDYLTVLGDQVYANRAGVYFNLGSLYLARGNLGAAEENLRRAATASGPIEAYLLLGQVETRLDKRELAESAYREAIARAPERPDAALALGELLDAEGRKDEARELYERVLRIAPNSKEAAEARTRLGT